ncbi:histidine kinase N-terminal 7TM domain-containing protein [Cohnella yongneupensis]|uniref:histidine kinase n=1 Tax=Cohnella yongneupensis TaxID=425006 RepID=A0ABW0R0B2_9BACL
MNVKQWMSIMLILAAALMLLIAWLSYRKRHLAVARTMILVMLSGTFYAVGYALEVLSRNLFEMKLSLQVEYLGIPFVTTLWLFLVIQFTGSAARTRRLLAYALFVVPFAIFFLHLTNEWHHLVYESYVPNETSSLPLYTTVKGPAYAVHSAYNYFVLICGLWLFVPMYRKALPAMRKQIVVLVLGIVMPVLFNLIFWSGWQVDMTPFGFVVTGFVYVWGIYRFNLLRLTPLAQAKVFDTIRDGVILLDYEDRIVGYNPAAEAQFPELSHAQRQPVPIGDALAAYPELVERVRVTGGKDDKFPFQRLGGMQRKHYSCTLSGIIDTDGNAIGKLLTFNDITELKETEEQLRENARQLSELNAFKDKLFTVVAHDIRDPIALMVSLTELLSEEQVAADTEYSALLQEVRDQARSTFSLVDNLLNWYRGQSGHIVFRPLDWNAKQVVRQALALAGARAEMKRIHLEEHVDAALAVSADKEMFDLILRNLLSNAIKYTGVGGEVEVRASREGDRAVLCISDNGPGIDAETTELLRQEEPFLKLASGKDEASKTRFGLVLTREFVRIHGGRLWFESGPVGGTRFYFTLPISRDGKNANGGDER